MIGFGIARPKILEGAGLLRVFTQRGLTGVLEFGASVGFTCSHAVSNQQGCYEKDRQSVSRGR